MMRHAVQHVVHAPAHLDAWPSDDRHSRLVFITGDVPRETIEPFLHVLLANQEARNAVDKVGKGAATEPA